MRSSVRNRTNRSGIILFLFSILVIGLSFMLATPKNFTSGPVTRLRALVSHINPFASIKHTQRKATITSTSQPSANTNSKSGISKMSYEKELRLAQLAVSRASILTKSVFREKAKGTLSKDDKSPVTIGDFGAQALIIAAIKHQFPEDEVVGEEEASTLREDKALSGKIWDLVRKVKLDDDESNKFLGGALQSEENMLDAIDTGRSAGGNKGRIWALDPIDGTKGFLRGGQYAVCLALMVDGDVKVGVLGCPNLPVDDSISLTEDIGSAASDSEGKGVIFSAVQGQGATSQPLTRGEITPGHPIHVNKITDVSQATLCESVEAGHSSKGDNAAIAKILGITGKPVQMDSQAKYGSVARGAGDLYLRLPVRKDYVEKIWDHAAGDLIVREAGGQVTDIHGNRLNFSLGRTLKENKGVIAAPANVHGQVLKAVQEVLNAK